MILYVPFFQVPFRNRVKKFVKGWGRVKGRLNVDKITFTCCEVEKWCVDAQELPRKSLICIIDLVRLRIH